MKKIYTKLLHWLLRPALPLPRQAVEFIDSTVAGAWRYSGPENNKDDDSEAARGCRNRVAHSS